MLRPRTAFASLAPLILTGVLGLACATREPVTGQPVTGLDRKLSTYAYIEEGDLVTLIVDTLPARDRDTQPYLPLEIAVSNNGQRKLTITRESFTLVDETGKRYPAASPKELNESYEYLDIDRQLAELDGIVFNKFAAYTRYPSNFSPRRAAGATTNIVQDLVSLPKFGYLIDFIYFPKPATGIRDHRFELFLDSPDLAEPVFVKFEVR